MSFLSNLGINLKCPMHSFGLGLLASVLAYSFSIKFLQIEQIKPSQDHHEIERFDVDKRFSDSIRYGSLVFISGQVNSHPEGSIEEQTKSALADVDAALAKAGSCKGKVLDVTVYLVDIAKDYDGMNRVYDEWLEAGKPPCRACVQAKLAKDIYRVEFKAIAAI